jgi:hypothetical protein
VGNGPAVDARSSGSQTNPSTQAVSGREDDGGGFFQGCLAKDRCSTPAQQRLWRDDIYHQIREMMSLQGSLSIERMCQMANSLSQRDDLAAALILLRK